MKPFIVPEVTLKVNQGHWQLTLFKTRVFKVTPFFDAEYITNGYIYGHS